MRTSHVLLLALTLAACGQEKVYRIGVLSRGSASDGAQLAAREANNKNGVNGVALRVQIADTVAKSQPDTAKVVGRLVQDTTVKVVLEQAATGVSAPVMQVLEQARVPVLVLGPATGETATSKWVFYLMPPMAREAQVMVTQAQQLWQPKRAAIVRASNAYGSALAAEVRKQLPAGTVVLDTPFVDTPDTVVVAALERTIRASSPDVLFWLGPPRVLGVLTDRMRDHLPNLRVMGSDAVEGKRIYDNADGRFSGLVFVRAADPSVDTARYNNFQYTFSIWQGGQGTSEALLAYDASSMVIAGMRAGARSRAQLRDYIASLGRSRPAYSGVTGPIAFDSAGVLQRPLGLAEVRDDGVKPVPLATTPLSEK